MKAILHGGPDDGTEVEVQDYSDIHTLHHNYLAMVTSGNVETITYTYRADRTACRFKETDLGEVRLLGGPGWMTRLDSVGRVIFRIVDVKGKIS